ncbi:MAG TPA: acyl-CoA reductase [Candidatus Tumulicola sp.]|nr:acyl-CoA reductase [Candidatus Tumulicola sp.]
MAPDSMPVADSLDLPVRRIAECAAEWRDPSSPVRAQARSALAGGRWPAPVVERALDNVLFDLDEATARAMTQALSGRPVSTLVILPGNIIGPAVSSAFCAALAGSPVILKAASDERHLAPIVSAQLDGVAGAVSAQHWRGGETEPEAEALDQVERVIAFGSDETLDALRSRIKARLKSGIPHFVPYGDSYSVGYVNAGAELNEAAAAAARDVCLFDQRGCMSPQTVYVRGDAGRATLFARALAAALEREGRALPRAALEEAEPALIASFLRRCAVTALDAVPHGLSTLLTGPAKSGVPEFVVVVEPDGAPRCAGFGRVVVVKPCADAGTMQRHLAAFGRPLETIGTAGGLAPEERSALEASPARRHCELGEMQRPPFGYRPTVQDFCEAEGA